MLLSEINSSCENPIFLSIMQGEEFDFTVTADDDLPLTNKNVIFLVKDSISGNVGFLLSNQDNNIEIDGQNILLKFREEINVTGDFLCQFIISDTVTGFIVKSPIGRLIINPSLEMPPGSWDNGLFNPPAAGPQGLKGDTGEKGDIGDQGVQGETGENGQSAYELAVADGFVGNLSVWLLSLKGEKGDTGNQGLKGDTGEQGIQGIQGLKGDTGDHGIQGTVNVTEIEIDFGVIPVRSKRFTITDVAVTAASKVVVNPSGNIATDRGIDDWEWDSIQFAAKSNLGNFILYAKASGGIGGKRKIFYSIN